MLNKNSALAALSALALVGGTVASNVASVRAEDTATPPSSLRPIGAAKLVQASFAGATEADPGFIPLNDACLTGAATDSSAPQTGSKLAGCQKSKNSPALGVTPGYLQLTDSTNDRTGGLLYNRPVAGNGGLYVAFDQYQYGGNGADGISFFLVDGTTELTTSGAYGGSLGYAQKTKEHSPRNSPGVSGAYLGIGLDVYGHFAQDNEGRGTGCQDKTDQKVPNAVTLRGGGEGLNGYCWIKTAKCQREPR